ncbi:MAG: iron chelate uptake ABC transporter family permease subunit [Actinophytocola sp.]|uniref:FecCD family ABC transporter permease n=1 Tax=Actinophytocola sp. TaxID=1872138 RepID=UPI001328A4FA|nr:iron chelate uptake ABC transporter family permease subunit [Actinophytocola sp.]MPZ83289.1 iron chelate uptake ABC transporter family permease subunit [Actinophytocola sp.]
MAVTAVRFRLSAPPVSGVLRPRLLGTCLALAAVAFFLFCLGMTLGDYPLSVGKVVAALFSRGDYYDQVVVYDWRMPRALVGLLVGVAFGMSGALFQTITRNPLASPDVIGISAGATTAVVGGVVLGIGAGLGTQTLGLVGGVLAALVIYLLAWQRGTTGYRIILVGIGVSWMCTSATGYLLARAKLHEAQAVVGWMVGNLNNVTWSHATPLMVSMAVLVPIAVVLSGWLRTLSLGDDVAVGLGTPVQTARLVLMLTGVGLVAFGTAAAGPVAFVALASPQIARRLAGRPAPPLVASACTGAVVVLGSDLLARVLLPDTQLPVGVVTGVLGAPFLLWLLARANRAGSGG